MRLLLVYLFDLNMCECVRVCSISCTWINAYRVFHDLRPWIQSWRRDSVTWSLVRRLTRSTINLVLHFRLDCAAVQTFPLDYLPLTFFFVPWNLRSFVLLRRSFDSGNPAHGTSSQCFDNRCFGNDGDEKKKFKCLFCTSPLPQL